MIGEIIMFIQNKYKKLYDQIITRALCRDLPTVYTESHHIVPRSLGGNDESSNLVILTAREHFICHVLLTKFTSGNNQHKMIYAVVGMSRNRDYQQRYVNSRLYATLKNKSILILSETRKGKTYEELHGAEKAKEMRRKQALPRGPQKKSTVIKRAMKLTGKKRTEEQRKTMSLAQENRRELTDEEKKSRAKKFSESTTGVPKGPPSESHKQNLSKSLKGKYKGVPKSEKTKANMSKPKT